jgi:hypothetical protein
VSDEAAAAGPEPGLLTLLVAEAIPRAPAAVIFTSISTDSWGKKGDIEVEGEERGYSAWLASPAWDYSRVRGCWCVRTGVLAGRLWDGAGGCCYINWRWEQLLNLVVGWPERTQNQ